MLQQFQSQFDMEGNLAEQGGVVGVSLAIIIPIIRIISDRDSLGNDEKWFCSLKFAKCERRLDQIKYKSATELSPSRHFYTNSPTHLYNLHSHCICHIDRQEGAGRHQWAPLCSLLPALCLRGLKELRAQPVPCTVTGGGTKILRHTGRTVQCTGGCTGGCREQSKMVISCLLLSDAGHRSGRTTRSTPGRTRPSSLWRQTSSQSCYETSCFDRRVTVQLWKFSIDINNFFNSKLRWFNLLWIKSPTNCFEWVIVRLFYGDFCFCILCKMCIWYQYNCKANGQEVKLVIQKQQERLPPHSNQNNGEQRAGDVRCVVVGPTNSQKFKNKISH